VRAAVTAIGKQIADRPGRVYHLHGLDSGLVLLFTRRRFTCEVVVWAL
jgi:hypothetical protein